MYHGKGIILQLSYQQLIRISTIGYNHFLMEMMVSHIVFFFLLRLSFNVIISTADGCNNRIREISSMFFITVQCGETAFQKSVIISKI